MPTGRPLRAKSCFGCWLCRWRWARAVFLFGLYFLSGGNLQPERNMQLHLPDYFVADLISTVAFGLPLDLRIGSPMAMAFANGAEFAGYNFSVEEIRQYVRRIGGQVFSFTDYVLRGVNTKTFDADDILTVRVRVLPNAAGGRDALLLRLYDEFAFAEEFLELLKDATGT